MIVIPENTTFIGELRSSGRLRIDGHFEGDGYIDGLLVISSTCVWKGKAVADVIVVEGVVEGELVARRKLEFCSRADVSGTITSPEIAIARGARVTGELRMAAPQPPIGLVDLRKVSGSNDAELNSANDTGQREPRPEKKAVGA
ncbi:MAG: polymer-forming cytoskeletal protein [Gammaproteobacteria bacterium]|nr:polymer-forming cytoskeletal protein [Gammaproteobacteria bacterium]